MFSDVLVIHRSGGQASATLAFATQELAGGEASKNWFFWQTCLRQIAVFVTNGDEPHVEQLRAGLRPTDEVMRGDEGYRFLLEIICGLHSPLVGETEVYGQFKNAVATYQASAPLTPSGSHLKRYFKSLFEDAKCIRQNHLVDLGSQSYGSVVRREVRGLGVQNIHCIGAGQLVHEILPWIAKDGNQVHIHARDAIKARRQLGAQLKRENQVHPLTEETRLAEAEVLIVAAPVAAAQLDAWLESAGRLRLVIDLRADSASDLPRFVAQGSATRNLRHLVLGDVFACISQNQTQLAERKKAALAAVQNAVHERSSYVEYRPFGWEDVCA